MCQRTVGSYRDSCQLCRAGGCCGYEGFLLTNVPSIPLISDFQDIFRRYPSTYEGVIPTLCANLEELDEPEAKASLIWIIGEYANKIDNADELLGTFVDTFTEESYSVRAPFISGYTIADRRAHVIGTAADAHRSREAFPV